MRDWPIAAVFGLVVTKNMTRIRDSHSNHQKKVCGTLDNQPETAVTAYQYSHDSHRIQQIAHMTNCRRHSTDHMTVTWRSCDKSYDQSCFSPSPWHSSHPSRATGTSVNLLLVAVRRPRPELSWASDWGRTRKGALRWPRLPAVVTSRREPRSWLA